MRHPIGWADLSGARVGVFGVGVEGRAAALRLRTVTSDVVFVDDAHDATMEGAEVVATDHGGLGLLESCDVVITSPGISRYRADVIALESGGVAMVGGVGLTLHDLDPSRVICVTGTKGKSTTASVLGHLLGGLGLRTEVTGNLGRPPFDPSVPQDLDVLIVETSSFQALDIADAPGVVVVTSLSVDHLDWHRSVEQYHADKLSLTSLPGAGITIAQQRSDPLRDKAHLLGGDVRWSDGIAGAWAEPLGLLGEHNLANAELARCALKAIGAESDDEALAHAAEGFVGLPGRLTEIGHHGGVRFVDDSLATNVLPTLAAIKAFEGERLAILIGGFDRGIAYAELIDVLARREAPTLVVGLPDSGEGLVEAIGSMTESTATTVAPDIASATEVAARWAAPDGVVLLSPAAPSFSQFRNWRERSEAFRTAVNQL